MSFHVDGLRAAAPPPRVAAACTQPAGTRPLDCGRSAPCGDRGRGSGNCANCPIPLRSRNRPYSGTKKLTSRLRSALARYRVTSLLYPGRSGDRRSAKPVAQIAEIGVSPGGSASHARIANWVAETARTAPTPLRSRNRPYSGAKKLTSRLRSALARYRVASLLYPGRSGDRRSAKPVAQIAEIGISPGGRASLARIANWVAETARTAPTPTACRDAMWWWASWQSDRRKYRKYRELTKACNSSPSASLETASPARRKSAETSLFGSHGPTGQNPALYTVRKNYLAWRAGSAVTRKLKVPSGRRSGEEFRCR